MHSFSVPTGEKPSLFNLQILVGF